MTQESRYYEHFQTVEKDLAPPLSTNITQLTNHNIQIINELVQEQPVTAINSNEEYVPRFTEIQRKQLDEQLRNVGIYSEYC